MISHVFPHLWKLTPPPYSLLDDPFKSGCSFPTALYQKIQYCQPHWYMHCYTAWLMDDEWCEHWDDVSGSYSTGWTSWTYPTISTVFSKLLQDSRCWVVQQCITFFVAAFQAELHQCIKAMGILYNVNLHIPLHNLHLPQLSVVAPPTINPSATTIP